MQDADGEHLDHAPAADLMQHAHARTEAGGLAADSAIGIST